MHFDPTERHEVQARTDARLVLCLAPWTEGYHDRHPQPDSAYSASITIALASPPASHIVCRP